MITTAVILLLALLAPILLIRFRKRWIAAFNLAVTNRITSRFAAQLPGFGIVTHVGRKSGKLYRTPINVFRAPEGFLIALTYGRESDWVKNVLAAGELETRGAGYHLSVPTIVHDPTRRRFPLPVQIVQGLSNAAWPTFTKPQPRLPRLSSSPDLVRLPDKMAVSGQA